MSQDYCYQHIKKYEEIAGIQVPVDEYDHFLNWQDIKLKDNQARDLTSPYGALYFAIGTADDFVCMDYAELPDGRIVLHTIVNSETGSFIDQFNYSVVARDQAFYVAQQITNDALQWHFTDDCPKRLHITGWNQDPTYFMRCVKAYVEGKKSPARKVKHWRRLL